MLQYIKQDLLRVLAFHIGDVAYCIFCSNKRHSPSTKNDHNKIYINSFTLVFGYICTINTKILKCLYEVCFLGFCTSFVH